MPKAPKKVVKLETVKDRIKANVQILHQTDDIEEVKKIVCSFYRGGNNPQCLGCLQAEDIVVTCKSDYLKRIESKPMETWGEEFDKINVRPKKKLAELVDIGLNCNRCYLNDRCPYYEVDATCAIEWGEDLSGMKVADIVDRMINMQFVRVSRISKIEEMEGGMPDANMSSEMDRLTRLIETKSNVGADKISISINGSRSNEGGNSAAGQKTGGILSALLGVKKEEQKPLLTDNSAETIPYVEVPQTQKLKK